MCVRACVCVCVRVRVRVCVCVMHIIILSGTMQPHGWLHLRGVIATNIHQKIFE